MRAAPTPEHVVEKRWRDHNAERITDARRKHENRVKGLGLVLRIDHGRRFWEFRGRQYGVPTVPWPLSVDMLEAQQRYDALVEQGRKYVEDPRQNPPPSPQEWKAVCRLVAKLFKRACHPYGWRRLVWWLTPSPLNDCPPSEVGRALEHFLRPPETGRNRVLDTGGELRTWDVSASLFRFIERYPALCKRYKGKLRPESWEAFLAGVEAMREAESREVLAMARAYRAAQTSDQDFNAWTRREELTAGVR